MMNIILSFCFIADSKTNVQSDVCTRVRRERERACRNLLEQSETFILFEFSLDVMFLHISEPSAGAELKTINHFLEREVCVCVFLNIPQRHRSCEEEINKALFVHI